MIVRLFQNLWLVVMNISCKAYTYGLLWTLLPLSNPFGWMGDSIFLQIHLLPTVAFSRDVVRAKLDQTMPFSRGFEHWTRESN